MHKTIRRQSYKPTTMTMMVSQPVADGRSGPRHRQQLPHPNQGDAADPDRALRWSVCGIVGGEQADESCYDDRRLPQDDSNYFEYYEEEEEIEFVYCGDEEDEEEEDWYSEGGDNCSSGRATEDRYTTRLHDNMLAVRRSVKPTFDDVVGEDQQKQEEDDDHVFDEKGRITFSKKRLYGRQKEIQQCHRCYQDMLLRGCASSTYLLENGSLPLPSFLLVSGYSGCGKTALVHEFEKQLRRKRRQRKAQQPPGIAGGAKAEELHCDNHTGYVCAAVLS